MNKEDKEKLLIVLFVFAFIVIALTFIFGTKVVPTKWIVAIILLCQFVYLTPKVAKLYYQAKGLSLGVQSYVPFWNQICIFPPKRAVVTLVSGILFLLAVGVIFVPADVRTNLFGEHFALNSGVYAIRIAAVFFVLYNVIVGASYCYVFRDIKGMLVEVSKSYSKSSKVEYLCMPLLFLPVIRCAALTMVLDKLNKLVVLNRYKGMNNDSNVLQEEK